MLLWCVYAQDDERLLVLVDGQEVHRRSLLSLEKPELFLCALTSRDGEQYCDETWWGQAPIRSHPAPTGDATASLQTGRRIGRRQRGPSSFESDRQEGSPPHTSSQQYSQSFVVSEHRGRVHCSRTPTQAALLAPLAGADPRTPSRSA